MSANVEFMQVGTGYVGTGKSGKSYIRINLRNDLASMISYEDLTQKMYLFKNTNPQAAGQYYLSAPVTKKEV